MRDLIFEQQRATSLRASCDYCDQPIGEVCINPRTGEPLEHQPAHFVRIRAGARTTQENA